MRVLVCGSRDWSDALAVNTCLSELFAKHSDLVIIEGGAEGADACAAKFAKEHSLTPETYPARWPPRGSPKWEFAKAGHDRNQRMLKEGKPDLVIAFKDSPNWQGKGGTEDMVRRAWSAGVPVRIIGS